VPASTYVPPQPAEGATPADTTPPPSRLPMHTADEIERVRGLLSNRKFSDSEILRLPQHERDLLFLERTKRSEVAAIEAANVAGEVRTEMQGLARQQAKMAAQLADHAGKIEYILRKMAWAGGIGGSIAIALKIVEIVTR
jgi:hypothetical protein